MAYSIPASVLVSGIVCGVTGKILKNISESEGWTPGLDRGINHFVIAPAVGLAVNAAMGDVVGAASTVGGTAVAHQVAYHGSTQLATLTSTELIEKLSNIPGLWSYP